MLGPVPLVALPRRAVANMRAAVDDVGSLDARHGRHALWCKRRDRRTQFLETLSFARRRKRRRAVARRRSHAASPPAVRLSWPGRHCRCKSALRAVSVRRGSMTMSFRPRARASCRRFAGLKAGMPPHIETSGLAPTSRHTSASAKACGPAPQRPCMAIAMGLPGWSIVALVKRIGEPIASMKASRSMTPGRTEVTEGAAIHRDRAWTVPGNDLGEPCGDAGERRIDGNTLQLACIVALQWMQHASGITMELVIVATFDAASTRDTSGSRCRRSG